MKTPVTYTAAVQNGTVSVSFSRKPRLLVRENIRAAGLRWKAESREWTGTPADPAALLTMLRDNLGAPAAVALDLTTPDPETAPDPIPETTPEPEPAPDPIPETTPEPEPAPDPIPEETPAADPEPETPARVPTLEEAEETCSRYHAALEEANRAREEAHRAADRIMQTLTRRLTEGQLQKFPQSGNLRLNEDGTLRRKWTDLTEEEREAVKADRAPFEEQEAAAWAEIERLKLCAAYAADNLSRAREDYYLPIAAEIVNRYAGRPAGEKTAAEISAKITAAAGCEARFWRRDNGYNEHHYGAGLTLRFGDCEWVHLYPDCIDGKTGKIKPYTPASHAAEYVTDIDAAVENLQTLEKQALGQMETVRDLCGRYNALLPASRRSDHLYPHFS